MRLDKDLIRKILLAVEASDRTPGQGVDIEIEGVSDEEVGYHVLLLSEAGYLVAEDIGHLAEDLAFEVQRLTFDGHELLDTMRDPEVWSRTKGALSKVGAGGLQLAFEIGKAMVRKVLVERTGLDLG